MLKGPLQRPLSRGILCSFKVGEEYPTKSSKEGIVPSIAVVEKGGNSILTVTSFSGKVKSRLES